MVLVFLQLIIDAKPLILAYKPIAVSGYDALDEICMDLSVVGKKHSTLICPVLLQALDKYRSFHAAMIAHALLALIFNGTSVVEGTPFQEFTVEQQEVLQGIATSTRAWRYNMNIAETMMHFGLPTSREEFNRFCGIS